MAIAIFYLLFLGGGDGVDVFYTIINVSMKAFQRKCVLIEVKKP